MTSNTSTHTAGRGSARNDEAPRTKNRTGRLKVQPYRGKAMQAPAAKKTIFTMYIGIEYFQNSSMV